MTFFRYIGTYVACSFLIPYNLFASTQNPIDVFDKLPSDLAVALTDIGYDSEADIGYDSELEYKQHQKVSNRFFRRLTRNKALRKAIEAFKPGDTTPIDISGLSSRTRILLFRELTASCKAECKTIHFKLNSTMFSIGLKPELRQPGDGIITNVVGNAGRHKEIHEILNTLEPKKQRSVSKRLLNARGPKIYNQDITNKFIKHKDKQLDLEMLNILLDFEVARRLQGKVEQEKQSRFFLETIDAAEHLDYIGDLCKEGENPGVSKSQYEELEYKLALGECAERFFTDLEASYKRNEMRAKEQVDGNKIAYMNSDRNAYDSIPIASGVIGILKLSTKKKETITFSQFFDSAKHEKIGDSVFYYGDFNPFQGTAGRRDIAVRSIIKKVANNRNSSKEEIHQQYIDVFGGGSESDGESYDTDTDQQNSINVGDL